MSLTRRSLVLGATPALLAARQARAAFAPATVAADFEHGGMQGFVLGGADRDPALLDAMAGFGANLARVFVHWRRAGGAGRYVLRDAQVDGLRTLLDRADRLGMRLMVAGEFQAAETAAFWRDADARDRFVDAWKLFARRFGQAPALAGIDLLNEPVPPMPSGDVREAQSLWRPLAAQAIAAIRTEAPALPIFFEPAPGGNVIGLEGFDPFQDSQMVYSLHFYTPHDITHQGLSHWTRRIPYPAGPAWQLGAWDRALGIGTIDGPRLERELRLGRAFQLRHRVPIQIGEFSCIRSAPEGSAPRWVADSLELFGRYGWSWTYHEFRGWPGWDAELRFDQPDTGGRDAAAPVISLLRDEMARRPRVPARSAAGS